MSFVQTNFGEEWRQRAAAQDLSVTSLQAGLYNDGTDAIGEGDDYGDITTEPGGSAYGSHTINLPDDVSFALDGSNNVQIDIDDQTFDVSDSSQTVDGYYLTAEFQSTVVDDTESSANEHLILTGELSQSRDCSQIDNLQVNNMGSTLD